MEEGYSEFATLTLVEDDGGEAALAGLPHPRFRLFLTARNRAEPDPTQRNSDRGRWNRIDGHRRADDIDGCRGDCRGALVKKTRCQIHIFTIGIGEVRGGRNGFKVRDLKGHIRYKGGVVVAR